MQEYCERHKMTWALDRNVPMPTEEELKKMPIEHEPKDKEEEDGAEDDPDAKETNKMFPFRLRVTYPKVIILHSKTE